LLSAVAEGRKLDGAFTRSPPPRGAARRCGASLVLRALLLDRSCTECLYKEPLEGGRAGGASPLPKESILALTRATVAFAFYPRHSLDGSPCRQPAACEDVSSQRASRPRLQRDRPPTILFFHVSIAAVSLPNSSLTRYPRHKTKRASRSWQGRLAMARPALAGVGRSSE